GKRVGIEWAKCVAKFFDFEREWGFVDGSSHMETKYRPHQVGGWIARGRKWNLPPSLGEELGTRAMDGCWVAKWWGWWESLQPAERTKEDGNLSYPDDADWEKVAAMYGKNGLLQVMATLCWWGEAAEHLLSRGKEPDARKEWVVAVTDMTWVLEKLLGSGAIER
ncbi:hypothetical protein B0H12DRAFT_1025641, partial [Mycena haematopus]